MLTKSKGVLLASALALAAAGGSVAVVRAESAGSVNAASAGAPDAGRRPGHGDRAGQRRGRRRRHRRRAPPGRPRAGPAGRDPRERGPRDGSEQRARPPRARRRRQAATRDRTDRGSTRRCPASAGQGEPGPLPAGTLPADGAVPGASEPVRALAAARRATTALPHSPRLLSQLAGPGGWPGPAGSAAPSELRPHRPRRGERFADHRHAGVGRPGAVDRDRDRTRRPGAASRRPWPPRWPASTWPPTSTRSPARTRRACRSTGRRSPPPGYRFAAVKATEGDYYVNPWAATDLAEAKAAGLDVSPYHFAIPNVSSGPQQAQYAVEYSGYAARRPDAAADARHRVRPVRCDRPHQRVLRPAADPDDRLDLRRSSPRPGR